MPGRGRSVRDWLRARARGELGVWRAPWLLVRGERDLPPGAVAIAYGKDRAGLPIALGAMIVAEVALLTLMVKWDRLGVLGWVRWPILLLGLSAVLRLVAASVAEQTHPHYLVDEELILRVGARVVARFPIASIHHVEARVRDVASPYRLTLPGPSGTTNLDLALTGPVSYRLPGQRRDKQTAGISLSVDEPGRAAAVLRAHGRRVDPSP